MTHIALKAVLVAPFLAAGLSGYVAPDQATSTRSSGSAASWPEVTTTPPTPVAAPPTAADFIIEVIVTEQKCFGSAGCNYRYTVNQQYISAQSLPEKTTVVSP